MGSPPTPADAWTPVTEQAPHNLPHDLTRFVGRERELGDVVRLTAHRLVTLTGPGGCGKTRLALRAAVQALESPGGLPDGAWLVDLAACGDADLVPELVAEAVEVREVPGAPLVDALTGALRERRLLLVLDNCEHLLDACAQLARTLLAACPELRVLATSRRPLGVPGEVVFRVPPLAHRDAVVLFLDRARRRVPGFSLTPAASRAVEEICRGLDGLPLAIELATARVTVLTVEQIAAMLSDCLELLRTSDRLAEPRHSSLAAALAWSYDLLDEPTRRYFARLSVFAGWWGLDAALALGSDPCGSGPERPVLDLLGALVDQSLVVADTGVAGAARYRILEPVRQFGLAELTRHGAADATRAAHAAFCVDLAARAAPLLRGPDQLEWLRRLDDAEPDLRAALGRLLTGGDAERAAELGFALWLFWWLRGRYAEGRRAMQQALAAPLPPLARARAAFVAGTMACGQADYRWAGDRLDEAVALFRAAGDRVGEAYALSSAGFAAIGRADPGRGVELLERGVEVALGADEPWAASFMSCFLGTAAREAGDLPRAAELGRRALALAREVGDREGAAMASHLLAGIARDGGDRAAALRHFANGVRLAAAVGDAPNVAFCLQGLAHLDADRERAVRLWAAADALLARTGGDGYLSRPDQEPVRRAVADARDGLGDEAFAAAWAAGTVLSPSDLLDEVGRAAGAEPAGGATPTRTAPVDPDGLTPREAAVLELIGAGLANKQIATELTISVSTVEQHVTRIYAKLGVRSRSAAVVHALRRSARLR